MTTNPQRSPDFRPNPERGIFLSEIIEQTTLDRLTPAILRLQNQSHDPITLYIDSAGGNISSASVLYRILNSRDQDGNAPCRLITVATGMAASAAADLLMAGNYALAYPQTQILCHGVRQRSRAEMLTQEKAIDLAKDLASSNERFAIQLADNCISRFIFRVATLASEFPRIRQKLNNPLLPNAECYIESLKERVPAALIDVLRDALRRSVDNDALDTYTSKTLEPIDLTSLSQAQLEILILKTILDYEDQQHSNHANWSVRGDGLGRIEDKLDLLLNKYDDHHADMTSMLCARWGSLYLSPEQKAEMAKFDNEKERRAWIEEAVSDILRPLWFFFVSICRLLQKEDYWMTAEDAYWLGLIDEVIGRTDLPSPRLFMEYPPSNDLQNDASTAS